MANEKMQKFLEAMQNDPKAKELLQNCEKPEKKEEVLVLIKDLAQKMNIDISDEDICGAIAEEEQALKDRTDEAAQKIRELPDDALDAVSGGRVIHDDCKDTYTDKENCWFMDACDNAWNYYEDYQCKTHNLGTK